MNLVFHRTLLCLAGATTGAALGAVAWFSFFIYYIFVLSATNPHAKTVLHQIGPGISITLGAVLGAFVCGVSALFVFRKQTAMTASIVLNLALAVLVISDDALMMSTVDTRLMLIATGMFFVLGELTIGWLVSTLYLFINDVLEGAYRGELFGLNKEREEEIVSLNIAQAATRRRIVQEFSERQKVELPEPKLTVEEVVAEHEPILLEDAVPELLFEPGRDWGIFLDAAPDSSSAKFSYIISDKEVDAVSIGEMLAVLLPFETASSIEMTTSRNGFTLFKQRPLAADSPRLTYRTGTLKPHVAHEASEAVRANKIAG